MSLLSICQGALSEIGEFEIPPFIVGNPNQTAVQILHLAQREGRELSRRHGWQALVKERTFVTTASELQAGALPADFRHIVSATWWDRTHAWPLFGPASAPQWQELKSGSVGQGVRRWFRMRGDALLLYPTPVTGGDSIVFEYVSDHWCRSAAGAGQPSWAADTDAGVLNEDLMQMGLVWRFLKAKGLGYAEEFKAYERSVETALARDGGAPIVDLSGASPSRALANLPETGFGS